MSFSTAISSIIAVLAIVVSIALYAVDQIDKRITKAVSDPLFLKSLAERVRLPFVIIDEQGVWRHEENAASILERIDVTRGKQGTIESIIVVPRAPLTVAPILEAMNFDGPFAEPTREAPYSWRYWPAETDYEAFHVRSEKAPDPEKRLVKLIKVTIIPSEK